MEFNIESKRFFTHEGLAEMRKLEAVASDNVKPFVTTKLIPYFLSDQFTERSCIFPVTCRDIWPPEFRQANLPEAYYVLLDTRQYNQFHLFIEFLNSRYGTAKDTWRSLPSTIDVALAEFDEYVASLKDAEKIEKVFSCSTGYTWYKLSNHEALVREGIRMGHCAGRQDLGHTQEMLDSGSGTFLSLRLRNTGFPVLTVLYDNAKKILLTRTQENKLTLERYMLLSLAEIMNYLGLSPETANTVPFNNLEQSSDSGRWHVKEV